jgi:hypothetical protein
VAYKFNKETTPGIMIQHQHHLAFPDKPKNHAETTNSKHPKSDNTKDTIANNSCCRK